MPRISLEEGGNQGISQDLTPRMQDLLMTLLFALTSIVTAALLFLVQPMAARMVLPSFGGSPQVWTTAMLFFQTALLAGYGYTHFTTTRLSRRTQPWLHLAVVVGCLPLLPIALTVTPSGRGGLAPSFELLAALSLGVAGPFVVIATSGPLVQRWFSWTNHPRAHDPYFLYAAGNIGSIGGLLAYPFCVEPNLSLASQSRLWSIGYVMAGALLASCSFMVHRHPMRAGVVESGGAVQRESVSRRRVAYWLLLAFVPSSLMLAVTAHLSTDVAAVPMLWVVPLAIYLLTFTIAFSRFGPQALRAATYSAPALVVAAITVRADTVGTGIVMAFQAALVLAGGLIAHGKLAADRPDSSQLTLFYLVIAVGGALGGVFNSLVAPLIFPTVFEYGLTAALTLGLVIRWREIVVGASGWAIPTRLAAASLLGLLPVALLALNHFPVLPQSVLLRTLLIAGILTPLVTVYGRSGVVGVAVAAIAVLPPMLEIVRAEAVERTFFGVHRVVRNGTSLQLVHGSTIHGIQDMSSPESRRRALSYYHAEEPLGDVFSLIERPGAVGAVGLGAGAVAAYGQPDQRLVFHEIDPAVVRIARHWFTYLDDTAADVQIILGDGRLTLSTVQDRYDLLIMDAFASDAIPMHLLTLEAFRIYLDAIVPDGRIAINISNRYLDIGPVLRGIADELGIVALERRGPGTADGAHPSRWVVLARDWQSIESLRECGWSELTKDGLLWTDQRSSLWSVVVW